MKGDIMKKSFITGIIAIALMLTVGGTVAHADDYISSKFPPEDLIVAWGTCSMGTSSTGWVYAGKTKDPSVPNSYYVYLYYRFDTGEAGSGTSFRLTRLDTNRWYIEPQKLMDLRIGRMSENGVGLQIPPSSAPNHFSILALIDIQEQIV